MIRDLLHRAYRSFPPPLPETESVNATPRYGEIRDFLLSLDIPDAGERRYLEIHLDRLAVTLGLVPLPGALSSVLELGAYMHMTPVLSAILGYRDVRGAYLGRLGESAHKQSSVAGKVVFSCDIALFDAEKDVYPYADGSFECVLACEIFEHFLHDPMHMLAECNRVLAPGGALVLTTPNVASATAVARVLKMSANPQLYSKYADPRGEFAETEVGHMREYTPGELGEVLIAGGFTVASLFTKTAPEYTSSTWVLPLLAELKYSTLLRGEQIFCLARKQSAVGDRYPAFLYER